MAGKTKPEHSYDDILDLPHHVSQTRLPMSKMDRAAQFSPFKSLVGLDAAMQEVQRQTTQKIELDENEKDVIDEKLRLLRERISQRPEIFVVYYRPDSHKDGGSYCEISGVLRRIDTAERQLVLSGGAVIALDDIYSIDF